MPKIRFLGEDPALVAALEAVAAGSDFAWGSPELGTRDCTLIVVDATRYPEECHQLLHGAQTTPLLLLAPQTVELPEQAYERPQTAILRLPFELFELRTKVRSLLRELPAGSGPRTPQAASKSRVREPSATAPGKRAWIDESLLAAARNGVKLGGPLLLRGGRGVGRERLARLLAAEANLRLSVWAPNEPIPEADLLRPNAMVWIPQVEERSTAALEALQSILDRGGCCAVVGSSEDLEPLAAAGSVPPGLYYQLSSLVVSLPSLGARSGAMDSVVSEILDALASRLGLASIKLEPQAFAQIRAWNWPGNLAELEAVLKRSVANAMAVGASEGDSLRVEARSVQLLPDSEPLQSPLDASETADEQETVVEEPRRAVVLSLDDAGRRHVRTVDAPQAGPNRDASLDLLVTGLAHDLRNPLSTIKTFAALSAASGGEDEALATMAVEACDRMDGELDLLHLYCDLPDAQTAQSLELRSLFQETMLGAGGDAGQMPVPGEGPPLAACLDKDFAGFIAAALCAQSLSCGPETALELSLDSSASDGPVCFIDARFPILGDAAASLGRLVSDDAGLPWRLALVADAVRRAGGAVQHQREKEELRLRISLKAETAKTEVQDGAQARRADRG